MSIIECSHPENKRYRDICNNNTLNCGVCHKIITNKIGNDN